MTYNSAPNPQYEAWCEEQPSGVERDGEYIETMHVHGNALCQSGGFTRYRGKWDPGGYGEVVVERDVWGPGMAQAAYFMAE